MNLWHDMKTRWDNTLISRPWWDGNRLQFTIGVQSQGLILAADMLEAEANRVAIAGDTANANVLWSMIGRIQATPAWDALAGFQARNTFLTIRAVAHT